MNIQQQFTAFLAIFLKEIRRFLRIWPQTLIPPVITMILYFIIFGSIIGRRIGTMGGVDYMSFVVPGLIMMSVVVNSYINVASSFFGNKFQRSIEEVLVAPVSPHAIILGYVGGGVVRGGCIALLVFIVALVFHHMQIMHVFMTIAAVFFNTTLFSLAGFVNGIFAKHFDDVSIVPSFILTPLTYLGGVFYSINLLPDFWRRISHLNPILYIVDTFRYGVIGYEDSNHVFLPMVVILVLNIALYCLCWKLLLSGRGLRS